MSETRSLLLHELLHFTRPTADVVRNLSDFGWDSDEELVTLQADHVAAVLSRFLSGEIESQEVEDWANAVECRDDIGMRLDSPVADVLHALANPSLIYPLTKHFAIEQVAMLKLLQPDSE